jgi:hypothetical protein
MKKKDPFKYEYCSANEDICQILDLLYLISDKIWVKGIDVVVAQESLNAMKKSAGPPKLSYIILLGHHGKQSTADVNDAGQ